MGINKLHSFLEKNGCIKNYDKIEDYLTNIKDKKIYYVGIDTLLYAYKYKYSINNIYIGFINQILFFLSNNIIPIYVIDGVCPNEKNILLNKRNNKKINIKNKIYELNKNLENINDINEINEIKKKINKLDKSNIDINKNDIYILNNLFTIFNICSIRAKGEADCLISYLNKKNIIDFALSDDIDIIVNGCSNLIKFKKKKIISYDLNFILNRLNLSREEFVELCILFGCDYFKYNFNMNNYSIYQKYNNNNKKIKNFLLDTKIDNFNLTKFNNIKNLFLLNNIYEDNYQFKFKKINLNLLLEFININCPSYNNINIEYKINLINSIYKNI